jgi:1-aminocyclopropane-1-carboxylate deaminase
MELHFVSRAEYRNKTKDEFIDWLKNKFGDFYLIPQGGSNELAIKGCSEFALNLIQENEFDYLCLPVGTGATMAGLICGVGDLKKVIGFSSLKGGSFLKDEISSFLIKHSTTPYSNWEVITGYHFGGYGKFNTELIEFKKLFEEKFSIPLDQVYTSKMMAGVFDLIGKKYFAKGSSVLAIHTGGLQGNYLNND